MVGGAPLPAFSDFLRCVGKVFPTAGGCMAPAGGCISTGTVHADDRRIYSARPRSCTHHRSSGASSSARIRHSGPFAVTSKMLHIKQARSSSDTVALAGHGDPGITHCARSSSTRDAPDPKGAALRILAPSRAPLNA